MKYRDNPELLEYAHSSDFATSALIAFWETRLTDHGASEEEDGQLKTIAHQLHLIAGIQKDIALKWIILNIYGTKSSGLPPRVLIDTSAIVGNPIRSDYLQRIEDGMCRSLTPEESTHISEETVRIFTSDGTIQMSTILTFAQYLDPAKDLREQFTAIANYILDPTTETKEPGR